MWHFVVILFSLLTTTPLFAIDVPLAPHMVVSGYAEHTVEPDMLTLTVAVSALEQQGIQAKQLVDTRVAAFFGQLEGLGIKRNDVEAGNLIVSPEYHYAQNKKPTLMGYRAHRQLAVKLYQLDKLSQLMDIVLNAGFESVSQIEYGLKSPQTLQGQVRMAAVQDANAKAEELAKAFGVKLGKVYSIDYRAASTMPVNSQRLKTVAAVSMADGESSYQQQIKVTDNIEAVFLLD